MNLSSSGDPTQAESNLSLTKDESEQLSPGSPTKWMRNLIIPWLERGGWQPEQLIAWLQGYNLPPVGHDEEPHVWLMRGLPPDDEDLRAEMARRVVRILSSRPDVELPGRRPDQVLYNLLMLCSSLGRPFELAEPLYQMFVRERLSGKWLGVGLPECLRDALIENQIDDRLLPVWEQMLSGQKHKFLAGRQYEGFAGILMRCQQEVNSDQRALDAIGSALSQMTKYLSQEHDCRVEFRALIKKVEKSHPLWPSCSLDLVMQAHKNMWPDWAVSCIAGLPSPEDLSETDDRIIPVWEVFIPALDARKYQYKIEETICRGIVSLVRLSNEAAKFLDLIVGRVESRRLALPFPSYRAGVGAATDTICEYQVSDKVKIKDELEEFNGQLLSEIEKNIEAYQQGREIIVRENIARRPVVLG